MGGNDVQVVSHHSGWAVETESSTVSRHITKNNALAAAPRKAQGKVELPIHCRGQMPACNSLWNDSREIRE
ncbi:hypothetical protein D3C72_1270370 [compost metagenome]